MSDFKNKIVLNSNNKSQFIFPNNLQGYGIRLFDFNSNFITDRKIHYDNKELSYYISFVNANSYDDSVGFMIIVDGTIQQFILDNNTTSQIIFNKDLKAHSLINIPVTFTPNINYNLDKHTVYFLGIYKQHFLPNKDNLHINTYIAPYLCELDIPDSSNSKSDTYSSNNYNINTSNLNEDLSSYTWTGLNNSSSIEPFKSNNKLNFTFGKQNSLYTFGAVLPDNLYSTIVFIDNEPITLDNSNLNILWRSYENKLMYFNFDIKDNLQEGTHQLYSITLPLENTSEETFFTSEKIKIDVNNQKEDSPK